MLDTLCEERSHELGWKDYTHFYIEGDVMSVYEETYRIKREMGL
jgi:hypothetical protein